MKMRLTRDHVRVTAVQNDETVSNTLFNLHKSLSSVVDACLDITAGSETKQQSSEAISLAQEILRFADEKKTRVLNLYYQHHPDPELKTM